jgi:hypothetical protein
VIFVLSEARRKSDRVRDNDSQKIAGNSGYKLHFQVATYSMRLKGEATVAEGNALGHLSNKLHSP